MDPVQSVISILAAIATVIAGVFSGGVPVAPANDTAVDPSPVAVVPSPGAAASASPSVTSIATPQPTAFAGWPPTGDESVDHFCEVTLAPFAQGNRSSVTRFWAYEKSMKIFLAGHPTGEDRRQLEACIDAINGLRDDYGDVDPRIVDSESMANVVVYIGPAGDIPRYLSLFDNGYQNYPRYYMGDYNAELGGYKIWKEGSYKPALDRGTTHAVIVIPSAESQEQRATHIWRYMAAILGAHGASARYPDSIFNPAYAGTGYSEEDRVLLRTLITERDMAAGLDYGMVVRALVGEETWEAIVNLDQVAHTFGG